MPAEPQSKPLSGVDADDDRGALRRARAWWPTGGSSAGLACGGGRCEGGEGQAGGGDAGAAGAVLGLHDEPPSKLALTTVCRSSAGARRPTSPGRVISTNGGPDGPCGPVVGGWRPMWHSDGHEHDGSRAPPFLAGGPASGSPGAPRRRRPTRPRGGRAGGRLHRRPVPPRSPRPRAYGSAAWTSAGSASTPRGLGSRSAPWRRAAGRSRCTPAAGRSCWPRPRAGSAPMSTWRSSARAPTAAGAGSVSGSRTTSPVGACTRAFRSSSTTPRASCRSSSTGSPPPCTALRATHR